MTIKNIIKVPDPFLRKKVLPVEIVNNDIKKLLDDMLETMYNAKGIGLAAPQISVNKRLIVMDCGQNSSSISKDEVNKFISNPIKMINPKLIYKSHEIDEMEEGCLSIPGYHAKVKRSKNIVVSFINEKSEQKELNAHGLLSVCIQHEIDHLNGILFVDHLSRIKRDMILKKVSKDFLNKNGN